MTALVRFSNASECVKTKDGVFGQCNDLVLTEETIWGGLEMEDLDICSDYVFVKFPFADVINKSGGKRRTRNCKCRPRQVSL